ncbi:MAG: hypothetical protein GY899_05095 [Verrucomicrobiaceae bacterium]|nr:hypothetical protein [Verrucomicrobiaceae bacterium]
MTPNYSNLVILSALLLMTDGECTAQVLTGPDTAGGATSTTSTQPGNTTVVNKTPPRKSKPFLGTDVPVFNPGTEIFSWDGQNWNVTNNRLMRARFEKYLNTQADDESEDEEYRLLIREILDQLSPHKTGGRPLQDAVALLPRASRYRIDANLCDSLSQAILGVYHGQKNAAALVYTNAALEREKKGLHWNVEVATSENLIEEAERKRGGAKGEGKGGGSQNTGKAVSNTGRVAGYFQRLAEIEAMKLANKAKIGISELQAKVEYQALILQFAVQRRWEHVIIASRMYRRLFRDGDGIIEIKEGSDADKMLAKGLGVSPTVTSLDMFANEIIRDVDEGVRAFEFLVEKDELESASKRLAESFFVGEYLPRIRTLARDSKQKVQRFVQDADALLSAMEVRDYKSADEIVERMRNGAKDFNYSKAKAGIQFYTNMSNSSLAQAKIAAQKSDMDEYSRQMQMAIEAWPLNPQIKEQNELFASVADVQVTTLNQLDTLLSQNNHREIMKQQGRFIAAVQNDPQRKEQLERVLGGAMELQFTLAKIEGLSEKKDPWGAWEMAKEAATDSGDDIELNKLLTALTLKVTDFAKILDKAKTLEDDGHSGMGLTYYLKAKRIYPNSVYAERGIRRLLDGILPSSESLPQGESAPGRKTPADPAPLNFD